MLRWNKLERPLILASRSPRRKQILENMGLAFTVEVPDVENEESYIHGERIEESVQNLAHVKALSVAARFPSALILGSDTIVVIDKQVIGKPANREDAKLMLQRLSGKRHTVYSGVALYCEELHFSKTAAACTDVLFRTVEEWEIDEYLDHDEYADKAGAYAIQGRAMTFIDKINGCFYNVMGLPVIETIEMYNAYIDFLKGRH